MILNINYVPDLTEFSKTKSITGNIIVPDCHPDWTPENCTADTIGNRARQYNSCNAKDMNVYLLSNYDSPKTFAFRIWTDKGYGEDKQTVLKTFNVYYLNYLRSPTDPERGFFKITWDDKFIVFSDLDVTRIFKGSKITKLIIIESLVFCQKNKFINLTFTEPPDEVEKLYSYIENIEKRKEQILFYPQNLPLIQSEYQKNWDLLLSLTRKPSLGDLEGSGTIEEARSKKINLETQYSVFFQSSVTPCQAPKGECEIGKEHLTIITGHQHCFRELLLPFDEKKNKFGLRNGTCVMVGFFPHNILEDQRSTEHFLRDSRSLGKYEEFNFYEKKYPELKQSGGIEYYLTTGDEILYKLDMRVEFVDTFPDRDKQSYTYLEKNQSLLYSVKSQSIFRDDKHERTQLLESLKNNWKFFLKNSWLLIRHGEAFHNLFDIGQLQPDPLDDYDKTILDNLKYIEDPGATNRWTKWKDYNQILNSLLTLKGVFQARRIYYHYLKEKLTEFKLATYIVSPLDRTIETFLNAITGYDFLSSESSASSASSESSESSASSASSASSVYNKPIHTNGKVYITPGIVPSPSAEERDRWELSSSDHFLGTLLSVNDSTKVCDITRDDTSKIIQVPFERIVPSYLLNKASIEEPVELIKKKFYKERLRRRLISPLSYNVTTFNLGGSKTHKKKKKINSKKNRKKNRRKKHRLTSKRNH